MLQIGGSNGTGPTEFSDIWDVARLPGPGEFAQINSITVYGRSSQLFGVVPTYQSYRAADGPLGGDLVMFAPFFSATDFRDHVCHGRPVTYEIRCLDANGTLKLQSHFPAYDWMIAGHDGELWVSDFLLAEYTKPYWEPMPANATRRFNIFARDGAWIGAVDVPARLLVKEAGRDYVLGVSRDNDNVEGVAMYRIIR